MRGRILTTLFLSGMAVSGAPSVAQTGPSPLMRLDDTAWQMLVDALNEAKTSSPAVHAKVSLEFAKQLDQDNKKSDELTVLKEAYLTTLGSPPTPYNTIGLIQSDIQRLIMKNLGPEPVEVLLPRMDEPQRGLAFDLLVSRYTADKNWDRAMDAVRRAPKDQWFPFEPAFRLMKVLPVTNVGARCEIFGITYAIYEKRAIGLGSLEEMIEQDWREFPREQVVELIPVTLRNAMRAEIYFVKRPLHAYEGLKGQIAADSEGIGPCAGGPVGERRKADVRGSPQSGPLFQRCRKTRAARSDEGASKPALEPCALQEATRIAEAAARGRLPGK